MLILVKLIGTYFVSIGIAIILNPKIITRFITFFAKGQRIYLAGILRFVIGAILLLAASQCRLVGVVVTLGVLTLSGGILIFVMGIKRVRAMLSWWQGRPAFFIRLLGLLALAIGALLIYSV